MAKIQIINTVPALRKVISSFRAEGKTIGLVPTMGNLHAGHISLVKTAKNHADVICATLFVNPKQFGEGEDFGGYPRTFDNDAAMLEAAGVEILYAPTVDVMYPDGFATNISVTGITNGLCGADRPIHFDGVCTVVTKLLLQALPDVAVFGEKDYQQLSVIRQFSRDLDIPVKIMGSPTLRQDDGLAMSSRNGYLTAEERLMAPSLNVTMHHIVSNIKQGADYTDTLMQARQKLLNLGFSKIDYLEICDEMTLASVSVSSEKPQRLFAAVHLGKARLIDNIPLL